MASEQERSGPGGTNGAARRDGRAGGGSIGDAGATPGGDPTRAGESGPIGHYPTSDEMPGEIPAAAAPGAERSAPSGR